MKNKESSILEEKKDQAKKLKVIAAPLVEYIRKNQTPHDYSHSHGRRCRGIEYRNFNPIGGRLGLTNTDFASSF